MSLADYLRAQSRLGWEAGVQDCCTFPGDWAATWGRGDPMAEWRGCYSTDAQAEALIAEAGGLMALWNRGLASIGAVETGAPSEGDVGVIVAVGLDLRPEHVGGIHTGRRWAFRAPAGLCFASAEVVKAWTHV
jgi:hypothetical protein